MTGGIFFYIARNYLNDFLIVKKCSILFIIQPIFLCLLMRLPFSLLDAKFGQHRREHAFLISQCTEVQKRIVQFCGNVFQ